MSPINPHIAGRLRIPPGLPPWAAKSADDVRIRLRRRRTAEQVERQRRANLHHCSKGAIK